MAERVAIARAVHQFMDFPPVFPDPLARPIIGAAAERYLQENLELFSTEGMRRTRGVVTIRSRFTEDELARFMVPGGAIQYVILGAGLDTFAYRRTDLAERITVFEVDQPATQRWKSERLAEAGIATPPNLRLVPLDFNDRTLAEGLAGAGFRREVPAFFSWLGVVYYLSREAILATLRFIAGQNAAVRIVFDFAVAESALPPQYKHLFRQFDAYNRTAAERWQTWFTPEEIKGELRACGFTEIIHLDAPMVTSRYLSNRSDGLITGPLVGLISASRPAPY
jgi:methyltransferase (TIGR00027 family)